MRGAATIFRFLQDTAHRGERGALVTITDVIGSSSRSPGTHMAISETGTFVGSFSGGCVEAAVVAEAQRIIATGEAEQIRFGAGSPFIDIQLPCGGGIDLLVVPDPDLAVIGAASQLLHARHPIALMHGRDGALSVARDDGRASVWRDDFFVARHRPDLRLIVLGHGAEVQALAALAQAHGVALTLLSPDARIIEAATVAGAEAHLLKTTGRSPHLVTDADTAVVFLFHDHDWEPVLLAQALEQDAFYVGAMGSRRTHEARLAALAQRGVPAAARERVVGPIGLIPATRDPETLALSVLAQIAGRRQG